jgi:putative ABC transport system ATP-binding protein
MNKKIIVTKEITKIYKAGDIKVNALRGINLEINEGEFVSIMGPSGSGKSTLMNIFGCLDKPTLGSYYLDGINVMELNDNQLAEIRNKKVGFVFQTFNLLPRLNIIGNVELPLVYSRGEQSRKRKDLIDEVVKSVGLTDWIKHRPGELSGGQRQRVAIARALINSPAIIMADEPTGNLDSRTGEEIMAIFQELNCKGKTIIFVTHEIELARHSGRIIYLKDGILSGEEIIKEPVDAYRVLESMPKLENKINNFSNNISNVI